MTTHPQAARLGCHHPEKLVCVVGDRDLGVELHSRLDLTGDPWMIGSDLPLFLPFCTLLELCVGRMLILG